MPARLHKPFLTCTHSVPALPQVSKTISEMSQNGKKAASKIKLLEMVGIGKK